MTQRRSSRPSSTVKYSDFEADDDFTDVSLQPSKKLKVSKQDEASKKSKKQVSGDKFLESTAQNSTTSNKKKRAPLSEKIYERELQEAMELSLLESGGSQGDSHTANGEVHLTESAVGNPTVLADSRERAGDSKLSEETLSLSTQKSGTQSGQGLSHIPGTIVLDERIEILPQEKSEWCPAQRQARLGRQASKKSWGRDANIKEDEDSSDCGISEEEESLSDDAPSKDDESDFDEKPKRKKPIKTKQNRNRTPLKKNSKTTEVKKMEEKQKEKNEVLEMSLSNAGLTSVSTCASNVNKTSPSILRSAADNSTQPKASVSEQRPKVSSGLTSQWKPPSRANSNTSSVDTNKSPANLSSPSSGLRLGLSRNQRVKPLHPSVQVG